ncbi:hypothetical protein Tco_0041289, partial [Tanacetum coccineum]
KSVRGMTQSGLGVSSLSSSGIGFNQSGLLADIYSSAKTREASSGSEELYSSRGGGSGRVVVVVAVAVVPVTVGACTCKDTGLGGERSMIGVDIGGTKDEA